MEKLPPRFAPCRRYVSSNRVVAGVVTSLVSDSLANESARESGGGSVYGDSVKTLRPSTSVRPRRRGLGGLCGCADSNSGKDDDERPISHRTSIASSIEPFTEPRVSSLYSRVQKPR